MKKIGKRYAEIGKQQIQIKDVNEIEFKDKKTDELVKLNRIDFKFVTMESESIETAFIPKDKIEKMEENKVYEAEVTLRLDLEKAQFKYSFKEIKEVKK